MSYIIGSFNIRDFNFSKRSKDGNEEQERDFNKIAEIIRKDWPKKGVWRYCYDKLRRQMSEEVFNAAWTNVYTNPQNFRMSRIQDGGRAYHFEPDPDAAAQNLPNLDEHDDEAEPYWNK